MSAIPCDEVSRAAVWLMLDDGHLLYRDSIKYRLEPPVKVREIIPTLVLASGIGHLYENGREMSADEDLKCGELTYRLSAVSSAAYRKKLKKSQRLLQRVRTVIALNNALREEASSVSKGSAGSDSNCS
jgi:hypothetical protein